MNADHKHQIHSKCNLHISRGGESSPPLAASKSPRLANDVGPPPTQWHRGLHQAKSGPVNSVFNSSPSRQSTPPASTLGSSILSFPTELYQTLYTRSLNDRLHEFRKFSSTVIANHPPESTSRSSVN